MRYTDTIEGMGMMNLKRTISILVLLAICLMQTACGQTKNTVEETAGQPVQIPAVSYSDKDLQTDYTDPVMIRLADNGSAAEGEGVSAEGNTVSILAGGTYLLDGTLTDGMILVDAPDADVRLVLSDADITNTTGAALYIREAKNVYLTLEEGSANRLVSAGEFVQMDSNNVDGALFSKSDITLNGTGSLTVMCETGHGIVSKDDLKIVSGEYTVEAAGQGISGKDSVAVLDGTFLLTAGKDGIHSEQEDTAKGNVLLQGGTYTIRAAGDGISASGTLSVSGGTYDIFTGNGSASVVHTDAEDWMGGGKMPGMAGREEMPEGMVPGEMPDGMEFPEGMMPGKVPDGMEMPEGMVPGEMTDGRNPGGMGRPDGMMGGGFGVQTPPEAVPTGVIGTADTSRENTVSDAAAVDSSKGLKAGGTLSISGGTFTVDAADDALHSNADLGIAGGIFGLASGDDGIHGDGHVEISGGSINITASYEGIEGHTICIAGGDITLQADDDGLNAAGGNDGSGNMGFFEKDAFAADENAGITISGGTLVMQAAGDGIDSNGYLHVTGGTTYVNGPINGANGALDYAAEGTITGGTFIALGSVGMAMNFDSTSTQGAMMVNASGSAGGGILLTDASGTELAVYTPLISYNSVVISAPGVEKGGTYTLTVDGTETVIAMTDTIYGNGSGMMGGGFGGFGDMGGGRGGKGGRGGW